MNQLTFQNIVASGGTIVMDMLPWVAYPFFKEFTVNADGTKSYNGAAGQLFPFRTFAMIMSFVSLLLVSVLTHFLFAVKGLRKWDFLKAFQV